MSTSNTGNKRIVRNPITGEELHYFKGPKQNSSDNAINLNIDHKQRVNEILIPSKTDLNRKVNSQISSTDTQKLQKPIESNFSLKANASSIPLLNFSDLTNDDSNRNDQNQQNDFFKNKLEQITSEMKIMEFKNSNPIVAPIMHDQTARPKSSYRYGFVDQNYDSLNSPIMLYQKKKLDNQILEKPKEPSPLASQLEAPRLKNLTNKITDMELINILPKPAIEKKDSIYKIERVADLERLWINIGQLTPKPDSNKNENEEKNKLLKEKLVVETVLTDQLNKFSLNPSNNQIGQNPQFKTIYTSRGNKFNLIDSHNSSNTRTTIIPSSLSESTLSKRCKFNCRVRTTDGKIALRELFGIFFLYDSSLTIYEYRLLCGSGVGYSGNISKKGNALPFIVRKCYNHEFGRRKNQKIDIWDIFRGSVLYLSLNPNELILQNRNYDDNTVTNSSNFVEVEVTDVDELDKENLLTSAELQNTNLSSDEMSRNIKCIKEKLMLPLSEIELNDYKIINSVRMFMRKQIEKRSVEVYMGLSSSLKQRSYRNLRNTNNQGLISSQDLYDALIEYNVQIHSEDLNIVWQVLDLDSIGYLSYYTVMRGYFGEMNITRHNFFRSLVHKLDTLKTGYVQINDIYKYYKANRHPRVKSGDLTENQMFEKFLSSFDLLDPKQTPGFFNFSTSTDTKSQLISYEQLEQYYNGLSIAIESDNDFIDILKNSWNLS